MPRRRRSGQRMTPDEITAARAAFLAAFRESGIVRQGCEVAGIDRATLYRWLDRDAAFAADYHTAEVEADDLIYQEVKRRGMAGWQEPVTSGGRVLYERTPVYQTSTLPDGSTVVLLDAIGQPLVQIGDDGLPVMRYTGRVMTVTKYSDACLLALASARLKGFKGTQRMNADEGNDGAATDLELAAETLERKLTRLAAAIGTAGGDNKATQEPHN